MLIYHANVILMMAIDNLCVVLFPDPLKVTALMMVEDGDGGGGCWILIMVMEEEEEDCKVIFDEGWLSGRWTM